jgi:histidine ammonia-lyase
MPASCRWCRGSAPWAQSGDLAPLSHLAIVLMGGGEAFFDGERMPGAEALRRAGLEPVVLLAQGRPCAEQRHRADARHGVLAVAQLEDLLGYRPTSPRR